MVNRFYRNTFDAFPYSGNAEKCRSGEIMG